MYTTTFFVQGITAQTINNGQMKPLNINVKREKNYTLTFDENFKEKNLNLKYWGPYYLPQWSSRARSKPNFILKDNTLRLQIIKNQKPWCPEFNGGVKCSSLQTGIYAGELGSTKGQHRFFNLNAVVRQEQKNVKKYVPHYGYFEMRAKFAATKSDVVALWMIGYEDSPEKSAELCIMEIKGWNVLKEKAIIGMGIHNFNDPTLVDDFSENEYNIDVTQFHIYAAEWTTDNVTFYIDNKIVKVIKQSPGYPMQFMLGIYEIPDKIINKNEKKYPKEFVVDYVRGYTPIKTPG